MTSDVQEAYVYVSLPESGYVPAGFLQYNPDGKFSVFGYGRTYLARPDAIPLDPVLSLIHI